MWDLLKKMAQGAATLGAEAFESWTLIERLVSMPGGQALEQLGEALYGMDDRAFIVFASTLTGMATTEENRIREAHTSAYPQQAYLIHQHTLRLQKLQGLLTYANQTRKQASLRDVTAVNVSPVLRGRLELAAAPVIIDMPAQTQARRPARILVDGSPPLSQRMVNQICEFYEWILDVQLTATLLTDIRTALITIWTEKQEAAMQNALDSIAVLGEVKKVNQATRNFWREENQAEVVRALRADIDEISRGLLELYDAANIPIAPGDPPLTREIADCYLELLNFTHAVASATEPIALTIEIRDTWAEKLAAAYAGMSLEERTELTEMPRRWTEILAAWPRMAEADKVRCQEGWAKQMGVFPEHGVPSAEPKTTSAVDQDLLQAYQDNLPMLQDSNTKTSALQAAAQRVLAASENHRIMQDMMRIHESNMRSNSNW